MTIIISHIKAIDDVNENTAACTGMSLQRIFPSRKDDNDTSSEGEARSAFTTPLLEKAESTSTHTLVDSLHSPSSASSATLCGADGMNENGENGEKSGHGVCCDAFSLEYGHDLKIDIKHFQKPLPHSNGLPAQTQSPETPTFPLPVPADNAIPNCGPSTDPHTETGCVGCPDTTKSPVENKDLEGYGVHVPQEIPLARATYPWVMSTCEGYGVVPGPGQVLDVEQLRINRKRLDRIK
jgi:hypothetical protein